MEQCGSRNGSSISAMRNMVAGNVFRDKAIQEEKINRKECEM